MAHHYVDTAARFIAVTPALESIYQFVFIPRANVFPEQTTEIFLCLRYF